MNRLTIVSLLILALVISCQQGGDLYIKNGAHFALPEMVQKVDPVAVCGELPSDFGYLHAQCRIFVGVYNNDPSVCQMYDWQDIIDREQSRLDNGVGANPEVSRGYIKIINNLCGNNSNIGVFKSYYDHTIEGPEMAKAASDYRVKYCKNRDLRLAQFSMGGKNFFNNNQSISISWCADLNPEGTKDLLSPDL